MINKGVRDRDDILFHARPFLIENTVIRRTAIKTIGHQHVIAQDTFAHRGDSLNYTVGSH